MSDLHLKVIEALTKYEEGVSDKTLSNSLKLTN